LNYLGDLSGLDEGCALLVLDDLKGAGLRHRQHARVVQTKHRVLQRLLFFKHLNFQSHGVTGGDPEDVFGEVLVAVFCVGALSLLQRSVFLFEGVGDVFKEDEAEDNVFVVGGVEVAAELVAQKVASKPRWPWLVPLVSAFLLLAGGINGYGPVTVRVA